MKFIQGSHILQDVDTRFSDFHVYDFQNDLLKSRNKDFRGDDGPCVM